MNADGASPLNLSQQTFALKDIKKLRELEVLKNMSVDQIKKMKITIDGKPISNYLINKYII